MFLLIFIQEDRQVELGMFQTIENGRKFVKKIPGYFMEEYSDGEYTFLNEGIDIKSLPNYTEIEYNGNILPITNFMFKNNSNVEIIWREILNFEQSNQGLLEGMTLVDAYQIENCDVKEYIQKREEIYCAIREMMQHSNFEVERNFKGSQDGEAIVYRKKGEETWHFLTHMDPLFVLEVPLQPDLLRKWIKEQRAE